MQVEENKTVDIDTSGPDTEVELKEDQTTNIAPVEETEAPVVAENQEASSEPQEASSEQQEATKKEEKKEELEDYSKDVQRRIAKLTKKWREAERQRDEALSFAKSQKEQRETLLQKFSSVEEAGVKDREAMIQAGLSAAQAKLAAARESENLQAEVDANKEIARLGFEEARLMEAKNIAEQKAKEPKQDKQIPNFQQQKQESIQADPKAEAWGAKNLWFGKNTAMTYTAFDLHKKLVDDEGYDPSSDEYYSELDKRIRVEFPQKFANNETKAEETTAKPVQQVASATRSTKTSRKTVRLTPSQVAIAKKLGVPLEEYAKQLKLTKEA
jgi:DNA repair exonuclease SbcCD ATPase subunit